MYEQCERWPEFNEITNHELQSNHVIDIITNWLLNSNKSNYDISVIHNSVCLTNVINFIPDQYNIMIRTEINLKDREIISQGCITDSNKQPASVVDNITTQLIMRWCMKRNLGLRFGSFGIDQNSGLLQLKLKSVSTCEFANSVFADKGYIEVIACHLSQAESTLQLYGIKLLNICNKLPKYLSKEHQLMDKYSYCYMNLKDAINKCQWHLTKDENTYFGSYFKFPEAQIPLFQEINISEVKQNLQSVQNVKQYVFCVVTKDSNLIEKPLKSYYNQFELMSILKQLNKAKGQYTGRCPFIAQQYYSNQQLHGSTIFRENYKYESLEQLINISLTTKIKILCGIAQGIKYLDAYHIYLLDFDHIAVNRYYIPKLCNVSNQGSLESTVYNFGLFMFKFLFNVQLDVVHLQPVQFYTDCQLNGPQKIVKQLRKLGLRCLSDSKSMRPKIDWIIVILSDVYKLLEYVY